MEPWVNAVDNDNFDLFKTAVNEGNIDNYVTVASGDEYTPVLYLARLSPPKNFKEMLEHCIDLNADLSLKAKTSDCMGVIGSKRCTTIGNLASWRESKSWNGDQMGIYDILVKMDKGEPNLFHSNIANTNALRWKKIPFAFCISSTWKPGCGIPGIGVLSSTRRTARFAGKAVVAAPVAAVGAVAGTAASAVGIGAMGVAGISKSPLAAGVIGYQLGKRMAGGRKSSRKSKNRKSRKSRRRY